ncbi:HD domain-containing protein [Clostridium sp. YIM B02515]|uniref:HD domain-containing protein n=1 Tax=Clostridium rhizosphaerae TaxID=2803861 RepID=A0ABS1TDW7_9CLOT|nr:HD domain-containing phosphohydrolase [Clostridium rhizosphaerae]MBL4937561.1 HD domain-containing protein [Clostridium rhizosphaerae]
MSFVKDKSIEELYKQHIRMIGMVICLIIISVFVLVFINISKGSSDSMIINILGRQRMLSQMMAKDVGRIYELTTIRNENLYDKNDEANIEDKLLKTNKELRESKEEYDKTLGAIEKGYINAGSTRINFKGTLNELNPILIEHQKVWKVYKNSIDSVLKDNHNSNNYLQSIKYINENNEVLLNYSDTILNQVLNYNNKKILSIYYALLFFIIAVLILLVVFIKRAYHDLLLPIRQLSKGMSNLRVDRNIMENTQVFYEVRQVFNEFNSLVGLIENLNKNIPFKDTLNYIFNSFSAYIPYTYIGVALIEDNGSSIKASYAVTGKYHENLPKRFLGRKVSLSETSLKYVVDSGKERIIDDLEKYVEGKKAKEYNGILLEEGIRSSITFPLKSNDKVIGIIFFSSKDKNVYKKEHIRFLKTLANSIVLSLEKDILMQDMVISSTLALAKLTEERDSDTGEHLNRMKTYAKMLAKFLSEEEKYKDIIDRDYIDDIERFAPLHDVGKVAIRDEILLKPGKLTYEEFETMKTHTTYGARVLSMADENLEKHGRSIFTLAVEIAEGHHEKWDGSGYPHGRSGEEIPLSARIVALADVFDALTSKRPYKKPFTFEESINIIKDGYGKHFDPYIIDVFIKNIESIRNLYDGFKEGNLL